MANLKCNRCPMTYLNAEKIPTIRAGMTCPRCNAGTLQSDAPPPATRGGASAPPPVPPRTGVRPAPPPPRGVPAATASTGTPAPVANQASMGALAREALARRGGLQTTQATKTREVDVATTQTMNGVKQDWNSRFQLYCNSIGTNKSIEVRIRVKVVDGTGAGSDKVKQNWGSKIERDWSGFQLQDETGAKWSLSVKMEWVDSSEHYTVTCNRGVSNHDQVEDDGTEHVHSWGEQDGTGGIEDISAISHEVGHMIGNCDEYGNVTLFSGRVAGNKNYGAVQEIHTQVKRWVAPAGPGARGRTETTDARRAYYGVPGNGIMGNVQEAPKGRNWYLVAREFAKLQHPGAPPFDVRLLTILSPTGEKYQVEAH